MRCLIEDCSAEIDERKSFPSVVGPNGQVLERIIERFEHEKELSRWTHVSLTANRSACVILLAGHVCPDHKLEAGNFKIMEIAASATVQAPTETPPKSKTSK